MAKKYIVNVHKYNEDFDYYFEIACNSLHEAAAIENELFYESECCNTYVFTDYEWKCSNEDIEKIEELAYRNL